MPSLWKKHRSGNRISPVVVDLQTRHKKNGSDELLLLDDESSKVSSSLVDLFAKHKDKLKKPSKKKQRSKKHATTSYTTLSLEDQTCSSFPILRNVSNQYAARSKLEAPASSTHEKIQNAIIAHDNKCDVSMNNDDCGTTSENSRILHRKNVLLTCILMSFLILMGIAFYNRMFVLGITIGAFFVFLLECVRNTTCWLFKDCEGVVLLTISKGASIVVVAFYTKSFLIGILLGVLLLILSECARKNIVRIFKPCEYAKDKLQDDDSPDKQMNGSKERSWNGNRDMVSNEGVIHSIGQKKEFRESVAFTKRLELEVCDDREKLENRDRSCSNKKFEETNMDNISINRISPMDEEKLRNKIISQIELLEQHNSVLPRQNNQPDKSSPTRYHVQLGKIEVEEKPKMDVELSDDAIENEKAKKRRKFWKKLVPKHMRKKNRKKYVNITLEESFMEIEDTEITDKEESSTFSSSDSNEDGEENLTDANCNYNEVFQANNDTKNYYETNNSRNDNNMKYLTIMIIPLAGLISGRILAFVLTVICCVVFKLLRR